MRRAFSGVLLGLLSVSPVSAQPPAPTAPPPAQQPSDQPPAPQPMTQQAPTGKPDDPTRLDPVVVTVTRTPQRAADAPASVTVLTREDISLSPSLTLDDLLRQVPGFSLFRRSSSLVTHPTTQGLSLRGIGPSGTSRALVLVDGIPVNDAFGGWVYWDRIPLQGIEQIEVVRGGGSSVWGNYALGGVVQVLTRRPTERAVYFDGSYGTQNTMNFDLLVHEVQGPFRVALEGSYFKTDGYFVVKDSRRGAHRHRGRLAPYHVQRPGRDGALARGHVLHLRHVLRRGPRQRDAAPEQRHDLRRRRASAAGSVRRRRAPASFGWRSTPTTSSSAARSRPRRSTATRRRSRSIRRCPRPPPAASSSGAASSAPT